MSHAARVAGCALLLLAAGCATVPRDPVALAAFKVTNDPLEPLNRKTFAFNQGVDRALLKPLAKAYVRAIPGRGRDGIRNFIRNLHEPIVLFNNVLQGEFKRAATTLGRFVLNTTVGVVGVMDFAGRHGLARQSGDFGQTLYAWGVHDGPYLVLPVVGPSSPRDTVGMTADLFVNPFLWLAPRFKYKTSLSVTEAAVGGIDERSRNIDTLDEIQREAVDFYASMRSLYRQNRAAELRHGVPPPAPKGEDLYSDPDSDPGAAPVVSPQQLPTLEQPTTDQPTGGQPTGDQPAKD
jgi:phospholipid-binding lipoprotein MlaA